MIALTLAEIAAVTGGSILRGNADTIVSGAVDTDSRELVPGGIFVAKPGEVTDGHNFVATAAENGAVLAIVEHPVDAPIDQVQVADVVQALADLAREVVARVRSHGRLKVLGVTGSNGKTTTKNFLARILGEHGEVVAPKGSYNNEVGAPLTMLRVTDDTAYLVCEFGASAAGEIASLASLVTPDVATVLMVGSAHAGGFGGIEQTAAAKAELVASAAVGGVAVLNVDDPRVAAMQDLAYEHKLTVIGFGQADAARVRASELDVTAAGTSCTVTVDGTPYSLHLNVLGAHHINNALAAIASALAVGVTPEQAIAALETVELAERWRMQRMGNDDVVIINDAYNASPDSMAAALRTLAQIAGPHERTVAVLGAMSELGDTVGEEHDRVGLLAVRLNIRRIVVVGDEARRLYISAIGEGSWDSEAVFFHDVESAYEYLVGELRAGDRVLVKSSNSAGLRHLGDRIAELYA